MADEPGFLVNKARISLVLAVISLGTVGWHVAGYFSGKDMKDAQQDLRLDQNDKDKQHFSTSLDKLTDENGKLTNAVTRLTTVLEIVTTTKKAELVPSTSLNNYPQK